MPNLFRRKSSTPPSRRDQARSRQREMLNTEKVSSSGQAFHRSRTLTGSLSSQVRSSNESATAQLQSPRVQAHHLARTRRHIGGVLLGVVAAIVILTIFVTQLTARASLVIDGDASIKPRADYETTIQDYFAQAPIERLRFMTNDTNLTHFLQRSHPEILHANVVGSGGLGTSTIELTMRHPAVGWSVGGVMRYVDDQGTPFQVNYFAAPEVKIIDKSGINLSDGQTLFSNAFLGFVGHVVGASRQLEHVTVTKLVIPPHTTRQVEVYLKGVSYPTKLSVDRPVGEQVEDMVRATKWLKHKGITPRYVDVRVSGEAYYK